EEEILEHGDHVEAGGFRTPSELLVLRDRLVRLEAEPDLERAQVSSSVWSVRSPIRSMRMTTRSSGSGQQTSVSCSSQSSSGSCRCFAGRRGSTDWSAYKQKCFPGGMRTRFDSVTSK